MRRFLVASLVACTQPVTVASQDLYNPPVATPSYVPSPTFHASKADRLTGPFNFSWDGKLLFDSAQGPCVDGTGTCEQLVAFGAHPEAVEVSDWTNLNGLPVAQVGNAGARPIEVLEGAQEFNNDGVACPAGDNEYLVGPGDAFGTFTVVPKDMSLFLPAPVGNGFSGCSATDPLVRYDFYVYADQNFEPYDPAHPAHKRCAKPGGIYRQTGFVIVDTATGDPCHADVQPAPPQADFLTSAGVAMTSIESSISADQYVIVMNAGGILQYTFNPTPARSDTWTPQRSVASMHDDLASQKVVMSDGSKRPATDVVPLAAQVLKQADGTPYASSDPFAGAYPWLSSDGSELFYEAVRISQGGRRGVTRSGFSAVGRLTNWSERHLDSWANRDTGVLDQGGSSRTNGRSPGVTPGLWNNWRTGFALPLTRTRPVFPLFVQGDNSSYGEVAFDAVAGGADLVYLEMNELVYVDPTTHKKEYDPARTPDSSGHGFVGRFDPASVEIPPVIQYAARTAQEAGGSPFFVSAKAAAFHLAGAITVASSPALRDFATGLSLEMFIRQDDGLTGTVAVASLPGALSASITGTTMTVTLSCGQQDVGVPIAVFRDANDRDWKHVAVTFKPLTNTITAYLDAVPVAHAHCNTIAKQTKTDPLVLGPDVAGAKSQTRVYWLDQVRLSRGERSAVDIAADALVHVDVSADLPKGLVASELAIPVGLADDAGKAALGGQIFHDVNLSANQQVACVTCHAESTAFADPRGVSLDLAGNPLPRSAPSLYNRAFGTLEMWDGAHGSLDAQATAPFLNPNEMGLTLDQLLSIATARYGDAFKRLYGGKPTQATIADAVARYVRTLVSGDAPIDDYLAGNANALTDSQRKGFDLFRGKARCIACHNGPSFTDELFHRQGFDVLELPTDTGRSAVACAASDADCIARLSWQFKTPSLRNVGITHPFFHDHVEGTLKHVVELYNAGPDDGLTGNHDPTMRPLGLTADEQAELVDFLQNALTSRDNRF